MPLRNNLEYLFKYFVFSITSINLIFFSAPNTILFACNVLELTRVADMFDTSHLHDSLLETVHTRIHIWLRFTSWNLFSISSQPVVVCQRLTFEFKVNMEKQQLDISHKCYVSETTVKPLLW